MLVSRDVFAKYPFTKEAAEYVSSLGLITDELAKPEFLQIITRAEQRVKETVFEGLVTWKAFLDKEIEILSYPVAIIFVAKINDDYLKRRYALAEAKRVDSLLRKDNDEKLMDIAQSNFHWKCQSLPPEDHPHIFSLSFIDYLENASRFRDNRWKLVNRFLTNGTVFLQKDEFARLISEEVRKHIIKTIEESPKIDLPSLLLQKTEGIQQILEQWRKRSRKTHLPQSVLSNAYPPCIQRLHNALHTGDHISHIGRFTLTSFLINIGMKADELVNLYTSLSDFDQRLTRYQVEHIAGTRGSGTRYTPPSCGTLKTHSLCPGPDEICTRIKHPLSYYWRKRRVLMHQGESGKDD